MTTKKRIRTVLTLAAVAMAVLVLTATSAQAATTTITGTDGGNDSWNVASNWDAGLPYGRVDVIVSDGVLAQVKNLATPTYSGSLTLNANSTLEASSPLGSENAITGASSITMNSGSQLRLGLGFTVTLPPITLAGDASIHGSPSTSAHWTTRNFDTIAGHNTLTLIGNNGNEFRLKAANSFSELIANTDDRWVLTADAAGSLGTGDVTVNPRPRDDRRSAVLVINAANAMADTATLTLNGQGWSGSKKGTFQYTYTRLQMNANDTIAALIIDGVEQPYGDYTAASGVVWFDGPGTLTVKPFDPNAPSVDAGDDMITWSGQAVKLDPNVVNNDTTEPQGTLTYLWSAEPNTGVEFSATDVNTPTVTITKPALTLTAVTIANQGFEAPPLADGNAVSTPLVWTDGYYAVADPTVWEVVDSNAGAYNPSADDGYGGVAPKGENVMFATSGADYDKGMRQFLSATLQANTQYDLSVLVGNPSLWNFAQNGSTTTADYRIELLAGGVVLESNTGPSPLDHTTSFITASLTHTSGADAVADPNVGQPLEIRLLAVDFDDGYGVDFDDVKLTAAAESPTPDPYTVKLTLVVNDVYNKDTMTIDVYDNACLAALTSGLMIDQTDLNGDCITAFEDFAVMGTKWLDDYKSTGPVAK